MRIESFLRWSLRITLLAGALLTLLNLLVELKGGRLCRAEGCLLVDSFAKSDPVMNLLGFFLFSGTLVSELLNARLASRGLLALALVAEGYLLGFQIFVLGELCHFCLGVFALILTANLLALILDLLEGRDVKLTLVGFLGFFTLLFMVWFVNPRVEKLPDKRDVILFSPQCPHCERVKNFCSKNGINATFVPVDGFKGVVRSLNLDQIPILVHRGEGEIKILVGDREIIEFLKREYKREQKPNKEVGNLLSPAVGGGACGMFEENSCSP